MLNIITLHTINSKKGGAYILKYEGDPEFTNLSFKNYSITSNELFERLLISTESFEFVLIHYKKDKAIFRNYVHYKKHEDFKEGKDLVLKVINPLINSDKFETDSNGLFGMERVTQETFESSVFPCN